MVRWHRYISWFVKMNWMRLTVCWWDFWQLYPERSGNYRRLQCLERPTSHMTTSSSHPCCDAATSCKYFTCDIFICVISRGSNSYRNNIDRIKQSRFGAVICLLFMCKAREEFNSFVFITTKFQTSKMWVWHIQVYLLYDAKTWLYLLASVQHLTCINTSWRVTCQ